MADFWARGLYHRGKKILRGPRSKEGTSLRFGMDGFRRVRKKTRKTHTQTADNWECTNFELFCKNFGSCDGQKCEY